MKPGNSENRRSDDDRRGVDPATAGEDRFQPTPEFRRWVARLPFPTPAEIVTRLRELGYVGQDRAVRAVALAAHRHVRRIVVERRDGEVRTRVERRS